MDLENKDKDILSVVSSVYDGVATEEERGMALRSLQTAMSYSLVSSLKNFESRLNSLNGILDQFIQRFSERVEVELNADTISTERLFSYIRELQSRQSQYLELYRKVIQSPKSLFSEDIMSEEEKKVAQLFKSFKTQEERRRFLALCEEAFSKPVESFDE